MPGIRHEEPIEIERKYLLRGLPPGVRPHPHAEFRQGYLPGDTIRERIRRADTPDGVQCTRTVKLGRGVVRQEFEDTISVEFFEGLWPLTVGRRIAKRRWFVPDGGLTWEVDEFLDRELVLAEVELPAADVAVVFPEWLASWVVREVTDDPAWLNSALAR